jgi:hypothetical protein
MNQDDNSFLTYQARIKQNYPDTQYPVKSQEGQEIESMLFALLDMKGLSPAEEQQRDSLANEIITNKLRNYTI